MQRGHLYVILYITSTLRVFRIRVINNSHCDENSVPTYRIRKEDAMMTKAIGYLCGATCVVIVTFGRDQFHFPADDLSSWNVYSEITDE